MLFFIVDNLLILITTKILKFQFYINVNENINKMSYKAITTNNIFTSLLKNITKQQNIYTVYNNSENGKNSQIHIKKYQKCPVNHVVNDARNIFSTQWFRFGHCLVHNRFHLVV